jgi:hypothetical protein
MLSWNPDYRFGCNPGSSLHSTGREFASAYAAQRHAGRMYHKCR